MKNEFKNGDKVVLTCDQLVRGSLLIAGTVGLYLAESGTKGMSSVLWGNMETPEEVPEDYLSHYKAPSGAELIAIERKRQVAEFNYTPERDANLNCSALPIAAANYLRQAYATLQHSGVDPEHYSIQDTIYRDRPPVSGWPFAVNRWRPKNDAVENLVKAGALIAAAIDRINRERETLRDQRQADRERAAQELRQLQERREARRATQASDPLDPLNREFVVRPINRGRRPL